MKSTGIDGSWTLGPVGFGHRPAPVSPKFLGLWPQSHNHTIDFPGSEIFIWASYENGFPGSSLYTGG